jgi:tetratricopeptide (TPR) repeat protein
MTRPSRLMFLIPTFMLAIIAATPVLCQSTPDGPGSVVAARDALWREAIADEREGRPDEAASGLRALLTLERQDHPQAAGTLRIQIRLISVLVTLGAMEEALPLAQEGYATAINRLGPDDPTTGDFRLARSRLLATTGRYDQAEPLLRQELDEELAAGRLEDARSTAYILARVYAGLNRFEDAAAVRLRVAEGDVESAEGLEGRIDLLMANGDKPAAEPLARRLVELRRSAGGRALDLRMARVRLARSLFHSTEDVADDPRIVEAEAIYRSLYAEERATGPATAPVVTAELGELLIKTAEADTPRQDEGLRINEEALTLMTSTLGPDHPETLAWLSQIAVYQFGMLQFEGAGESLTRLQNAREAGAAITFTAAANALTVSAGLALQQDDPLAAHRILSRESHRLHNDLILASRRDGARALQAQTADIDRLRVSVAWRAAQVRQASDR